LASQLIQKWIANQVTEACGWEQAPHDLIRDRDGAYGEVFIRRLRSMGIRDRPTSPRSPWQNAYAERLIGSIRRECLDHVVVFGERHLRHVLLSYMKYHNEVRTHLSLEKDAQVSRALELAGHIFAAQFSAGYTTNISGFDLRQAQGSPFRPLYDDRILFSGQPIVLVVAEESEIARFLGLASAVADIGRVVG
jgi:hypothetical protein